VASVTEGEFLVDMDSQKKLARKNKAKLETIARIQAAEISGEQLVQKIKVNVIAFEEQLTKDFPIEFDKKGWVIIPFADRNLYKTDYYFTVNIDKPSNLTEDGTVKDPVYDFVKSTGKPYMVCELSAFRQNSYKSDVDDWYFTLGWFNFMRTGFFNNNNCNADRWEVISKAQNILVKDYRTDYHEKYALVCLQKVNDSTMASLHTTYGKYRNWIMLVCNQIRNTYPRMPIVLRPHLRTKSANYSHVLDNVQRCTLSKTWENRTYFEGGAGLQKDLDGAGFVVSYNSNVLTQSTLAGVPSICWDIGSQSAPGCLDPSQLGNLREVYNIDRQQWLNNLAYTQWTRAEIRDGRAWQHLNTYMF